MMKKTFAALIALNFLLPIQYASACDLDGFGLNHYYVPGQSFLVPSGPKFQLWHPSVSRAPIGSSDEVAIKYNSPPSSEDLILTLTGTQGIELSEETIKLDQHKGTVTVRFSLNQDGHQTIKMKLTGKHDGKVNNHFSILYVRAKEAEQ
ncbi:hypothetical protein KFE80_01400 [bacterium SCSIO 12696]|nr:hypothetical protein KFE80_01400 [bacterium SCSIO 12696]